ncbi:hormogonium polysaccharide biosynthesis protein HpsA [Thermosynechococcaceae cyanobacterium BACA0444]|uniref:Hormogonium polysaccharide biosynthesis protein HpsA n=1 Tax=Pseudocalidococcus azoricus BACA0444 TaxID=2918990 RepID=A0AAE4JW29_9CYAN|nr:hormogonium polysaccharide biosynthesis protein HpsA [Pseudocalidococcus azoricus]MDS3860621.1 hormogonium polysaccharide biosynthesis protein HpsA [Pseudocalidococcus azoricus BACA0444]
MSKRNDRFGLSKRTYRKLMGTLRHLFRQLGQWLRRRLKGGQRQSQRGLRLGRARGFVLPTAVLVVLVVSITIGALLIRSLNRTTQVSGQRQDLEVVNQATPAIERAKAKLEYMFSERNSQLPSGIPGEETLQNIMLGNSEYTLSDETRINIAGDSALDNAWYFQPTPDSIVAYSITMRRPNDTQLNQADSVKAAALTTRNRPLKTDAAFAGECNVVDTTGSGSGTEAGWDTLGSADLRKNFQIDAFVYTTNGGGKALATVETVQERRYTRGNKWGAWFRNDLEIFPGPAFRWNGAMHTEGTVYMGGDQFSAYLVSAPKSCIYSRKSSEITSPGDINDTNKFLGHFVSGTIRDNTFAGTTIVHSIGSGDALVTTGDANPTAQNVTYNPTRDSVNPGSRTPASIALNPVKIITQDVSESRTSTDIYNHAIKDSAWPTQFYTQWKRTYNQAEEKPYVDDTYRADNRYGPKPVYGKDLNTEDADLKIPTGSSVGDPIPSTNWKLLANVPYNDPSTDNDDNKPKEEIGLDGYWERRARAEGLRLIVGQRLEVGKPLEVPTAWTSGRANEFMQHRALWDNLAAVQGTVLYPYNVGSTGAVDTSITDPLGSSTTLNSGGGQTPIACLASAYHPGTPQTALRSIRFNEYRGVTGISTTVPFTDFLTGRGTDGWEFAQPSFNSSMVTALTNLTNFSADRTTSGSRYKGAFPPVQESSATVRPNFTDITHGDFSNLYRALQLSSGNRTATGLSLADQSYLDSAACGVGLLAYELSVLQGTDNAFTSNDDFYTSTLGNGSGSQLLNLDNNGTASSTDRGLPILFNNIPTAVGTATANESEFRYSIGTDGVPLVSLQRINVSTQLTTNSGYASPELYVSGLVSDWSARPGTTGAIANEQNNTRLARLIATREQAAHDMLTSYSASTSTYECGLKGLTNARQNLRTLFCLGELGAAGTNAAGYASGTGKDLWLPGKFGAVLASSPANPAGSPLQTTLTLAANNPSLNYNYDLTWLNRLAAGDRVYISGSGVYTVISWNSSTRALVVNTATPIFESGTGTIAGSPIAWTSLAAGTTVTPAFTFSSGSSAQGPMTRGSNFTFSGTNAIDTSLLPSSLTGSNAPANLSNARIGFRFSGTDYVGTLVTATTNQLSYVVNIDGSGTNFTIPASTPIALLEYPIINAATVKRLPLYTFNTVQKYTALQPLFRPTGGTAVNPNDVKATPRAIGSWTTPNSTSTALSDTNQIIGPAATDQVYNVAFLDGALFNGREEMNVRAMDINLGLLRATGLGTDTWLPMSGLVYAAREDGMREDGIARPTGTWMNAAANPGTDPALGSFGISIKPVDFFADPMRRPHGFKLRNGLRLDRVGLTAAKNVRGLSFISDNPAYIEGDFNWHTTNGTTGGRIEEFTQLLPNDFDATTFYTNRTTRNTSFARPTTDTWRPTEILADAVSILSGNFCSGSANDYWAEAYNDTVTGLGANSPENWAINFPSANNGTAEVVNSPSTSQIYRQCGASASLRTSYLNANRPRGDGTEGSTTGGLPANSVWVREDPFDPSTPVYVNPNGLPMQLTYTTGVRADFTNASGAWYNAFTGDNGRSVMSPSDTRTNAVIVSGTVTSRPGQSYGGMHNFPRFIQAWGNLNLWIQGSFLQLNFSTSATGPFDQDRWESGSGVPALTAYTFAADTSNERINYYGAPTRRWGYDPGLQLAPAGPVAARFINKDKARSVFFTELPADDPYILRLRCAFGPSGTIDPSVTGCPT